MTLHIYVGLYLKKYRPLFEHLDECGTGLKPYCNLIPGGKYGSFFQEMQNLFYYMQIMANVNSIEDIKVNIRIFFVLLHLMFLLQTFCR